MGSFQKEKTDRYLAEDSASHCYIALHSPGTPRSNVEHTEEWFLCVSSPSQSIKKLTCHSRQDWLKWAPTGCSRHQPYGPPVLPLGKPITDRQPAHTLACHAVHVRVTERIQPINFGHSLQSAQTPPQIHEHLQTRLNLFESSRAPPSVVQCL